MWQSARNSGVFLAPAFGLLLQANDVPTSVEKLTAKADLVADVKVSKLNAQRSPPNEESPSCFQALVIRRLKGVSGSEITICLTDVSEMNPPVPELGGHYTMYLEGPFNGIYVPFSFAGFRPVTPVGRQV